MDPLAHVFLPLLVIYAVRPGLFDRPWTYGLAGFGLLPDVDKFLGLQGFGHSLVLLVPLALLVLGVTHLLGEDDDRVYSIIAICFMASHVVLDALDGGPAPVLYPLVKQGIGLTYPATVTFGKGVLGLTVNGPVVALHVGAPRTGHQSFGFVNAFGVASAVGFVAAFLGRLTVDGNAGRS